MSRDMLIPRPSNPPFGNYNTNAEGGLVEHATSLCSCGVTKRISELSPKAFNVKCSFALL